MITHDDIDNLIAADLHSDLSEAERNELHTHLVECAACRQAYQENKLMNKMLEETLASEKPNARFEQRMLSGFRNRVPGKGRGIAGLIADLMRLRSARIAAVAALLLALVQVGRMITPQNARSPRLLAGLANEAGNLDREESAFEANGDKLRRTLMAKSLPSQNAPEKDLGFGRSPSAGSGGSLSTAPDDRLAAAAPPPIGAPAGTAEFKKSARSESYAQTQPAEPQVSAENAAEAAPQGETPAPFTGANRKLIRNATVDLEIASFEEAVQKLTVFANEAHGYIATSSSQKQANGKLKGEIVVRILPENLDSFLQKVHGLGELKDQKVGTEDITKQYLDTDARLKNARVMEQRLIDMLKKKTGKVSDLLQVEKELGRVRGEIEKMQGELKYWDSQVQFASVTISLTEKDMEEPAAFLLKEHDQLALYAADVEKSYNEIKALASSKVQITNAQLDRDSAGRVLARMSMLIVPEESDAVIGRVKKMGRIDRFETETERVAQGGNGISENAKTRKDKVELNITITRGAEEQAVQQTSLRILTANVDQNATCLKSEAKKAGAEIRSSTFSRDPNGREVANISLRVPMKKYTATMESFKQLGQVKGVQVQRQDRTGKSASEENAPADISIQMYSQGNIVPANTGLFATLRNTLAQGVGALMWSLRMIGVAIAFLAPWAAALVIMIWIAKRVVRRRRKL
jgi:hypothetical protein